MADSFERLIGDLPGVSYRLCREGERWFTREISGQMLALTGYSAQECLNTRPRLVELVVPEDLDYVLETIKQELAATGHFTVEYRIKAASGVVKYLWERGRGVSDERGELREVVGFIFDSSHHQQRLQRVKDFQRAVLNLARNENLSRGNVEVYARECLRAVANVMKIDRGSVWSLNPKSGLLSRLCLYVVAEDSYSSGETLLVRDYPEFLDPLIQGRALDIYDAQHDPRSSSGEVGQYLKHHDVKSMLVVPVRKAGEVVGLITLEQEHSKRRWANDETSLVYELADLLQQSISNRELQQAQSRLLEAQAAHDTKKAFLGIMSHEVRTPLNGVLGGAELLSMTNLDERQREYVASIEQSSTHLMNVVKAVIDLAELQDGTLVLESGPTDVADLLHETCRVMELPAAEKSLQLTVEVGPNLSDLLLLDGRRLGQVVLGLVSNGIEFTEKGLVQVVANRVLQDDKEMLRITVTDTGMGIPEEIRPHIFSPFVQERQLKSGRALRGMGLSLAICKDLASLMNGTLVFTTEEGKGTRFALDVPLELMDNSTNKAQPSSKAEIGQLRTLIVEDDRVNQKVAAGILKKFGIEADVCDDGSEAVARIRGNEELYDLILMDCEMPVMDGFDATRAIRKLPPPKNGTYIAALTAHAVDEYRNRARDVGMDDFLTKPLNLSRLETLLSGLVSAED